MITVIQFKIKEKIKENSNSQEAKMHLPLVLKMQMIKKVRIEYQIIRMYPHLEIFSVGLYIAENEFFNVDLKSYKQF